MVKTVKRRALFLTLPVCLVVFIYLPVFAQFEQHILGARSVSFGGAGVVIKNDPWAAQVNPALYGSIADITLSAVYIPGRFALQELESTAASVVYPGKYIASALSVHRFGFELYSETTFSLSGAYNVSNRLAVGGTVNWYHLAIENYGSASTIGFNAGLHAHISDHLSTGFVISNVNRPAIGQAKNTLPQIIRTGLKYRPHPLLHIAAEIEKDILFDPEFRLGAEYLISESFHIRAGMNDRPARASGGFTVHHRGIKFDYAFQWHFELGQTHYITLTFSIPVRRKQDIPDIPDVKLHINTRPSLPTEQLLLRFEHIPKIQDPVHESLLRFINSADESDLIELPRIGPVMAQRIIIHRNEHGLYETIPDFQKVQGIGERTIEDILNYWRNRMRSND